MKDKSIEDEDTGKGRKERGWFAEWIERLFEGKNWEYLSQGCISYPYCHF